VHDQFHYEYNLQQSATPENVSIQGMFPVRLVIHFFFTRVAPPFARILAEAHPINTTARREHAYPNYLSARQSFFGCSRMGCAFVARDISPGRKGKCHRSSAKSGCDMYGGRNEKRNK
jgi:hypothetical protein